MTTDAAIKLIRNAIVTLTGLADSAVLIGDKDNPRPSTDHIWIRMRDDIASVYPSRSPTNDILQPQTLRLEFEAVGKTAAVKLRTACSVFHLQDDPTVQGLGIAGIGILTRASFTNVSALLKTAKEPRLNATISFSYLLTDEVDPPEEVTAIILDGYLENTLEYNETFEIEP